MTAAAHPDELAMAAAEAGGSSLPTWDPATLGALIAELDALVDDAVELEARVAADLGRVHPEHRSSARNLVHYLALRRRDIRALQKKLAALGLSSLGRIESHVLGNVLAVRGPFGARPVRVRRRLESTLRGVEPRRAALASLDHRRSPPSARRKSKPEAATAEVIHAENTTIFPARVIPSPHSRGHHATTR